MFLRHNAAAAANVLLANQESRLRTYTDTTLSARWSFTPDSHLRLMVPDAFGNRQVVIRIPRQ